MQWDFVKEILEGLGKIAPLATIVLAVVALRNVALTEKSIGQAFWYGELSETIKQSERYIERFLPAYREIDSDLTRMGYPNDLWPNLSRMIELKEQEKQNLVNSAKLILASDEFRVKVFNAMNQLELIAMSFAVPQPQKNKALLSARERVFRSMAFSFCACCDRLGIFAIYARDQQYSELYSNTIDLYYYWEPKVGKAGSVHQVAG